MRALFFLTLLTLPLFSLTLKEKLLEADPGDYMVMAREKSCCLLHVHTKSEGKLLMEEISVPERAYKKFKGGWKEWVSACAPNHSSWILYEIDLKRDQITHSYSFSEDAYLAPDGINAFLMPLLKLNLSETPLEKRRRIGPPPVPGAFDHRRLWAPPLYIDGKRQKQVTYDAYRTVWPKDGSELAGKELELYFPTGRNLPFPNWLQIADGSLKLKLRALDAGKGLSSPCQGIPPIPTQLTSPVTLKGGEFQFALKTYAPFSDAKLIAIDITSQPRTTLPLEFTSVTQGNITTITTLAEQLEKGHDYVWVLSMESPEEILEIPQTIRFLGR